MSKYSLYISLGLNALAVQYMWLYHVPPWLQEKFVPEVHEEHFGSSGRGDDLRSLGSIYEHLNEALFEIDKRVSTAGVPTHRLQLALATYIVRFNQELSEGGYGRGGHVVDPRGLEKANATELTELRERAYVTDWAYLSSTLELEENLKGKGYVLLRHDTTVAPGDLAHFLAFHPEQKEFVVCIKGTSSVANYMTDLLGSAQEFQLPNNPYTGENTTYTIHAHEGMMKAATHLMDKIIPILEHLVLPTEFKITVHGHSLGGGCAALLGLALRARLPEHRDRIQVYAFAPAAVLTQGDAIASNQFITSVVNRADVVPRISFLPLQMLMYTLVSIDKKLEEFRIPPRDQKRTMKLIQHFLTTEQAPFFATRDELEAMIVEASEKVSGSDKFHLLVPGRVVALYGTEKDQTYTATDAFVADGANLKVQVIQVERSLFSDHRRSAYIQSLDEALGEPPSAKAADKPRTISGRLSNYFRSKLPHPSFSPTTRLDSPFAAIVIASLLFWRMLSAAINSADQRRQVAVAEKAQAKKAQPKRIKKF